MATPYFTCNVRVNCVSGQTVPLYDAPESSSNTGYSYSDGQSALSAQGLIRNDGTLWYRITATMDAAGTKRTFWLKYESGKMTVTNLMPKGSYTLTPQCAPASCLDVKGGSAADGASVRICTSNGSTAQQWELPYLNNGYYTITCKASGMALDVAGASADAGANVQQYTPNGTDAQQWMLKDAGDGSAASAAAAVTSATVPDATRRPVTVTFDPNGGSAARRSMTVAYEDMFGNLPEPTRAGYTFDGWYTSAGGGVRMTANTVVFNTSDFTPYAHWTEEVHTHTRRGSFVSDSHPHYKYYTCTTCGGTYTENSATYVSSCSVCNPPKETGNSHAASEGGGNQNTDRPFCCYSQRCIEKNPEDSFQLCRL